MAMVPKPNFGEQDLHVLLSTLTTVLHEPTYVFVTVPSSRASTVIQDLLPHAQMLFREVEGLTLILPLEIAEAHMIEYSFPSRMITLNVHSSLAAVGFLAVITDKLKTINMPVNPVSAFFHDHIFVPAGRETEALEVLKAITEDAKYNQ